MKGSARRGKAAPDTQQHEHPSPSARARTHTHTHTNTHTHTPQEKEGRIEKNQFLMDFDQIFAHFDS